MSEVGATFAFVPWLRRGISAAGGGSTTDGRLSVPIEVSFGADRNASVTLQLCGPGEVTGLDARVVTRTFPARDVRDAELNFFPMVEFSQADMPWRHTPIADAGDRLPPWLCLLVLKDQEITGIVSPGGIQPLPVVNISNAPLPLLSQSWAWAHAQVTGTETITPSDAVTLMMSEPHRLGSRLLCPRRLDPQTRYTAILVPTFERGRLAGMGHSVEGVEPLAPGWQPDTTSIQLPIYYSWHFTTGVAGDFEELVRRLAARELPAGVGLLNMDVSDPGAQLPLAAEGPLGLEGPLRATQTQSTPWPESQRQPFVEALASFLNRPTELLEGPEAVRALAPPLYARWHAAQDRLAPGEEPLWFQEVNTDPRWRVAAGLGAQVVQANQRQLMAAAWQHAEGLHEINETMRVTQFAREIALRIHSRHVPDDDELTLQVTSPIHNRVLASPVTIAAQLQKSPISQGAISSVWRRVARPLGPIGRRQGRLGGERPRLVARMNREELAAALPPPTPTVMVTPARAGKNLVPSWATPEVVSGLRTIARFLIPLGILALLAGILVIAVSAVAVIALALLGAASIIGAMVIRRLVSRLELSIALRDGSLSAAAVEAVPPRPNFVATESALVGGAGAQPAATGPEGQDSPSARAFRAATANFLASVASEAVPAPPAQPVDLHTLRNKLVLELDPTTTIGAAARRHLDIADFVLWQPADPLEPVLAGPDFPQPMYEPLAELAKDWVLPGLEQVPPNTVSLVETNRRFVEAFMLGLNHEMGRELLWREYPSDQRRTFFRQFWDARGFVPPTGGAADAEKLKDIPPIHKWQPSAALGENSGRDPFMTEQLVLLIRGDVIQRYPNLLVYAARAVLDTESGKRVPGTEERQPVFSGTLPPDVAFFGFPLTRNEVATSADNIGWFFVLQEQPSEPRFGLDIGAPGGPRPQVWNDLTWGHLVTLEQGLANVDYVDLNAELPDTTDVSVPAGVAWHADAGLGAHGSNSAQLAFITLQRPVRISVHADDMLP